MIDTHCHLGDDYKEVLQRAFLKGVHHVINICIHPCDIERGQKIVKEFPTAPMAAGIHPCHAHETETGHFEQIVRLAQEKKIVAVGETGLDLHHSKDHLEIQKEFFKKHIELANDLDLALSIHCRNAYMELKEFVEKHPIKKGILHCFAGPKEIAAWALDRGFTLSFSGVVTFKNALEMQTIASATPLSQLLVETDAPWLAPEPFRGKINEPAYIPYIVEKLATLHKMPVQVIQEAIYRNSQQLFRL
jgi:TatD DNase family protein